MMRKSIGYEESMTFRYCTESVFQHVSTQRVCSKCQKWPNRPNIPPSPTCAVAKDESFSTQDASKWSHFQHIHRSKILKYQMISDADIRFTWAQAQLKHPNLDMLILYHNFHLSKDRSLPVPRGLCSPVWPTWWLSERPPGWPSGPADFRLESTYPTVIPVVPLRDAPCNTI